MLASEFKRCTRVCNTHPVKRIKEAEAVEAGEDEVEEQPRSNNGKREGANVYWDSCIESLIGFSKPKYQHPPPHLQKKKSLTKPFIIEARIGQPLASLLHFTIHSGCRFADSTALSVYDALSCLQL